MGKRINKDSSFVDKIKCIISKFDKTDCNIPYINFKDSKVSVSDTFNAVIFDKSIVGDWLPEAYKRDTVNIDTLDNIVKDNNYKTLRIDSNVLEFMRMAAKLNHTVVLSHSRVELNGYSKICCYGYTGITEDSYICIDPKILITVLDISIDVEVRVPPTNDKAIVLKCEYCDIICMQKYRIKDVVEENG